MGWEANGNQDGAVAYLVWDYKSAGWRRIKAHWRALTFEEDELALAVLVGGVYLGRQAPPEEADEHGVPRHHRVISHPPKPVVLEENTGSTADTQKLVRVIYSFLHIWLSLLCGT